VDNVVEVPDNEICVNSYFDCEYKKTHCIVMQDVNQTVNTGRIT